MILNPVSQGTGITSIHQQKISYTISLHIQSNNSNHSLHFFLPSNDRT
uniref:Uncharacterized protein n=1 Tax=Rhizophora mucronata TaxID=61149 RepID=A0A2P2QM27_RHIMU